MALQNDNLYLVLTIFFSLYVCVCFLFFYHSARSDNTIPTPMAMAAPKIISDQKINFCFVLLLSISCCFCACLSISLTTSVSNPCLGLCCLFLGSYSFNCFFLIEGEELGLLPRAPNHLLRQFQFLSMKKIFGIPTFITNIHIKMWFSSYL